MIGTTRRSGVALAIGVGAALALTGCGSSGGSKSASAGHESITMITGVKSDPFYITMTCAAQAEAKAKGIAFTGEGSAQWDVSVQRPLIDSVAASKPDGLLISPVDTSALTPSLKQIQSSGTKIGLVDTSVTDPSVGITRISSNNLKGGQVAADALAKQSRPHRAEPEQPRLQQVHLQERLLPPDGRASPLLNCSNPELLLS